jgi:hypothetical protein
MSRSNKKLTPPHVTMNVFDAYQDLRRPAMTPSVLWKGARLPLPRSRDMRLGRTTSLLRAVGLTCQQGSSLLLSRTVVSYCGSSYVCS